MTNMEYILSRMTERDLAELFTHCGFWSSINGNLNKKVVDAFRTWQKDTDKPNRNFTKEGEPNPSVYAWSKILNHKKNKWETGRTDMVSFQQWLGFQYNKKHWKN